MQPREKYHEIQKAGFRVFVRGFLKKNMGLLFFKLLVEMHPPTILTNKETGNSCVLQEKLAKLHEIFVFCYVSGLFSILLKT